MLWDYGHYFIIISVQGPTLDVRILAVYYSKGQKCHLALTLTHRFIIFPLGGIRAYMYKSQ